MGKNYRRYLGTYAREQKKIKPNEHAGYIHKDTQLTRTVKCGECEGRGWFEVCLDGITPEQDHCLPCHGTGEVVEELVVKRYKQGAIHIEKNYIPLTHATLKDYELGQMEWRSK